MTAPAPEPDLLVSLRELEVWTQQESGALDGDAFAEGILWGTSVLIRAHGHRGWTAATLPDAAKLIAIVVAKNYYEHPTGAISESVAVLSDRFIEAVVHNMELMPEQIAVLERLAAEEDQAGGTADFGGLQVLTTTRGPLETGRRRRGSLFLRDTQGNAIAMADTSDLLAMYAMTDPA